jgi:hypothetical protein
MTTSSSASVTRLSSHAGSAGTSTGPLGEDVLGGRFREHQAFEEGIGGEAVRAVQAGAGDFARRVEARHAGASAQVGDNAAAHVVGRGHHRDRVARDVDAELQAALVNRGEVRLDERRPFVRDVEVHAVDAVLLDLEVDRAGDDVARGELRALVVARHEAFPVGELQDPALAAHRLGDQERLRVRVEEAGRMELDELHVRDLRPRAPRHGDAVAARRVRVGGEEIDLPGAARRDDGEARADGLDPAFLPVEDVGAPYAVAVAAGARKLAPGDEVDGAVPLEDVDLRMALHAPDEGVLHRPPGGVGRVGDPPVAVPPSRVRCSSAWLSSSAGEGHPLFHQPFDGPLAALDHEADGILVAQARPATRVSRMWSSTESAPSRTAAMPPWAQLEAPTRSSSLVTRATLRGPASRRAADMPARPLPIIRTS